MLSGGVILLLIAIITVSIAIQVNQSMGDAIDARECGTNTSFSPATPSTCGQAGTGVYVNWSCNCPQWNATTSGTEGMAQFGEYWTAIVSVIILVVIVGLFVYFRGGAGGVEIR